MSLGVMSVLSKATRGPLRYSPGKIEARVGGSSAPYAPVRLGSTIADLERMAVNHVPF
jgi:hypothetical protein